MDSEIKEVIYISISAIILSIVLTFISFLSYVQRDIAESRNDAITGRLNMIQYREFDKYNKKELIGDEVIECIKMYYDSGLTIYVASNSISQKRYNMDEYLNPAKKQYFEIKEGCILMSWFTSSKKYRAYLVYNSEDPEVLFNRMWLKYVTSPESISGTLQQKYDALDRAYGEIIPNSEVTGILIIDSSML